jgi:quinol monooxygenase YgiN
VFYLRWVADLVLLGEELLNYQSMTTISKEKKFVTLINVFTVDPAKQQQLVDLLTRATESSVRHIPGFISASLHRSLDGAKVAMYAQWRSVEDYQAMRKNAAALPYMEQALTLAKFEVRNV